MDLTLFHVCIPSKAGRSLGSKQRQRLIVTQATRKYFYMGIWLQQYCTEAKPNVQIISSSKYAT